MNLLDFLVSSDTRRKLLVLLWAENVEASGHQLAKLASAAYSGVHQELESMVNAGLVSSRPEGKAVMFRKNDQYPYAHMLVTLLEGEQKAPASKQRPTDHDARLNLSKFGAPLAVEGVTNVDLSLEQTLVAGLALSRRDATVARVMPVVFAKNKDAVDSERLEFLARRKGLLQVLGLFWDLTGSLMNNKELRRKAKRVKDNRRKRTENFFLNTKSNRFEQALAEANTPSVVRDWKFTMNMNMDSFESSFRKSFPASV
jgi:hypothetical protein